MSGLLGMLTLYVTRLTGTSSGGWLHSLSFWDHSLSFSASLSLLLSPSFLPFLAGSVALPVPVGVGAFGVRWGGQAVGQVL